MNKADIVDDLVRKKPKGPKGVRLTYVEEQGSYNYKKYAYDLIYQPSVPVWGYTKMQLFDLGFRSRKDVEEYIRQKDFGGESNYTLAGKKTTLTRRTNSVWNKLEDIIADVEREGGVGVYKISQNYGYKTVGYIYSTNKQEAADLSKLMFGYLYPDQIEFYITYVKSGDVHTVAEFNAQRLERYQEQIDKRLKQIKALTDEIDLDRATIEALRTVETQQVAVEKVLELNSSQTQA